MEENNIVAEEQEAPEHNDVALEEVNQENPAEAAEKEEVRKDNSQENIRRLREAKERAERERAILEEKLQQYTSQDKKAKQEEPEYSYGDEDLVEGRHLKKEMDSIKKQLSSYKREQAAQTDEARLKNVYSDFDKVVTPETIEKLRELDPETAETIATSGASLYARGAAAYKRIKETGAYVEDAHQKDRAKAHENASKPRPLNSVSPQQGNSPLSMANAFANGLTPELKKQLWKEVQEASKRH